MNMKILGILVVLAVLAVGGVLLTGGEEPGGQVITQQHLVPGLEEHINAVEGLRLTRVGDELVAELARTDAGWVVTNRDNYPANLGQVRQTLLNLATSRLMEEKTSSPEFYERLGVSQMSEPDATGIRLELTGLDGEPVALIIGDPAESADGTYARRAGEEPSWLASGALVLPRTIGDWLDTQVMDIPVGEIQSITIRHPDDETLRLEKTDRTQTDFTVVDIPEGRELESQGGANALGSALAGLQLEDVLSDAEPAAGEAVHVRYRTFDGLVVETELFQRDERHFLRFTEVSYDEELARRFAPAPGDSADTDEADVEAAGTGGEATLDEAATAEGQQRASDLAVRVSGWVYQIPAHKHDNMTKRLAELLKPVEEPPPAEETPVEDLVPILPERG